MSQLIFTSQFLTLCCIAQTIGAWKYIHHPKVAPFLHDLRIRLSQVIKYLTDIPGLESFRDIYREFEVDWFDHAAECLKQVQDLIDLVAEGYETKIATGTTPANWLRVQQALQEFTSDLFFISAPPPLLRTGTGPHRRERTMVGGSIDCLGHEIRE